MSKKEKAEKRRKLNKLKYDERIEMEKGNMAENKSRELSTRERNNERLYLGELIERDKPGFKTNNLILAPTGSGKSHLIETQLIPNYVNDGDTVFYLVSTTSLKDSVCPKDSAERIELAYPKEKLNEKGELVKQDPKSLGFYTSGNEESFGDVDYRVHVMTYAEFGRVIEIDSEDVDPSPLIICDEIHSAQNYRQINRDIHLSHAIRYLFKKHEGQTIYYFTATREHLDKLNENTPNQLKNVTTFDYREHPEIRKFVWLRRYEFNHLEQIRKHLVAGLKGAEYYGYKTLAFTAKIKQMEVMEQIFKEEGYNPLLLWSVNSDIDMTPHQIEMRRLLLSTKLIPSPYNVLIINGGMQEGWDLKDDSVRMAVINSTNETEVIQSVGRIRGDITTLVQRTNEKTEYETAQIPDKYIEKVLTSEHKGLLCKELNLRDKHGRQVGWPTVKKLAEDRGYEVVDERKVVHGKKLRVSTIKRKLMVIDKTTKSSN